MISSKAEAKDLQLASEYVGGIEARSAKLVFLTSQAPSASSSSDKELGFAVVHDPELIAKLTQSDAPQGPGHSVLFLSPDKQVAGKYVYPSTTEHNFDEICRVLESLQLGADSEPKRVQLPKWFVPDEYVLTLHPNADASSSFRFEGQQDLKATITQPGNRKIVLHSRDLNLLSAVYASGDFEQEATKFDYDIAENTVTLSFAKPLPTGAGVLKTEFIGTHNNQMAGFYRSNYVDADKQTKVLLSTQFEALDARRCFPCVDEPQAKATFTATLVADANLTCLSNMPESEITWLPGGKKKRVQFMTTPKMSTYLLAFAVGELDFVQKKTKHGVLVRVFTPPTKSSQGLFALDVACQALDIYDDYFAVPYPLPKLDMIAIPEFAMGAMENWGLVTYREVELLIKPGASARQKQRVTLVVTHELAHQWFGNLVTMAWWDGLWLNEGFASWVEYMAADEIFPSWKYWSTFVVDDQSAALSLDSLVTSHPVEVPIYRAEEVEEVFDGISYHKGACVVQLANAYLGPELFREGLRLYFQRHQYGNTETKDLWQAWEDVSGMPVGKVIGTWTSQMGFPVVAVSKVQQQAGGKLRFKVKQSWFLADGGKPPVEDRTWPIPMLVASLGQASVNAGLYDTREETEYEVDASSGGGNWVKLNAGQKLPIRVLYTDAEDVANLAQAVRSKAMSAEDRAGLILDAYALTKSGLQSPSQLLVLLRAYEDEDNMAVWDSVDQVLGGLSNLIKLEDAALVEAFRRFAAQLSAKQAARLGWEEKSADEAHVDQLSRAILVRLQCAFDPTNPAVSAQTSKLFGQFLENPTDPASLNANIRTSVLRSALAAGGKKEMDQLKKTLEQLDSIAEKKDVYAALGFTKDVKDKRAVLDWATSGAIKLQDFFYPMASVSASGGEGAELAFQYMKEEFPRIHGMIKKASPSLIMGVISYCCAGFASVERADEIEAFFQANPVPLATRKVAQIVESTKTNAAFLQRVKQDKQFIDTLMG